MTQVQAMKGQDKDCVEAAEVRKRTPQPRPTAFDYCSALSGRNIKCLQAAANAAASPTDKLLAHDRWAIAKTRAQRRNRDICRSTRIHPFGPSLEGRLGPSEAPSAFTGCRALRTSTPLILWTRSLSSTRPSVPRLSAAELLLDHAVLDEDILAHRSAK